VPGPFLNAGTGERRASRRAPADFDPVSVAQSVLIEDWVIREYPAPECEVLEGTVWRHPHIADGRRTHTTDLIWIDEAFGWARSLFRFYRLGQRTRISISPMVAAPSRLQPQNNAR
jgi:hypothetical protein